MSSARRVACLLLAALGLGLVGPVVARSAARAATPAATISELFEEANARYWEKDFEGARVLYHRILGDYQVDNPEVYYNLGNVYSQLGLLGSAVLYYKRALRSEPGPETEEAIRHNLELARGTLVARNRQSLEQNRMLFDESHGIWYTLFHLTSERAFVVVFLVFYLGLAAALVLRRLSGRSGVRRAMAPTAIMMSVLALVFGGLLLGNVATTRSFRLGVVVHQNAQLRPPGSKASPVALPEGLELRILREAEDGRLRVRLSNGREGFLPLDSVKEI